MFVSPYRIQRVEKYHLPLMCALLNQEAQRSAATVAHCPEDVSTWVKNWEQTQNHYPWLVALDAQNQVIGYAKASAYNAREGFNWTVVLSIYLYPEIQGKGVGSILYQHLIQCLIHQGYRVAYARITLPNSASLSLHNRFGFKQVGFLPHFAWKFDQWHDQALLVAPLGDGAESPPQNLKKVDEVLLSSFVFYLSE